MISISDKKNCCGCQACGDICPKTAITFKTDREGFWYPEVDKSKCVNCGLCEKTCPQIHADDLKKNDFKTPKCIAAIHKDLSIRFDSTSGGLFTALAEKMLKGGGYVFGAIYTEVWSVKWLGTNRADELPRLRSSKYLQSDSSGMYRHVKELLSEGKEVLVCALPCQVAALRLYLSSQPSVSTANLILVDLICRYINSPFAYRKYLDFLEKEYGAKIVYIKAKNKELGWRNLTHKCVFENGRTYFGTFAKDIFMKASMRLNCLSRPSCYDCAFKGFPRIGDITIGDYWVNRSESKLDDDTGTSIALINSLKGVEYFAAIQRRLKTEEVPFEKVLPGNPALLKSLPRSSVDRNEFFTRIATEDFRTVVDEMAENALVAQQKKRSPIRCVVGRIFPIQRIMSVVRMLRKGFSFAQYNPIACWQFVYLNFFHPAVHSNWRFGHLIYPTPYCVFDIDKGASIELNGSLSLGCSPFKHSHVETRIKMQKGARMVIGSAYGFGYGSDIEIFPDAYFESSGIATNSFTTIICQEKIVIGKHVACGRNVTLRDNNGHHLVSVNGYRDSRPIIIGDHVWLTQSVTVMSGVKIGDGTIISAGTLVNSSFPSNCVVAGSPAHITQRNIYWKM